MKSKRILVIVLIIIGIVLILFSSYITSQVEAGKMQVAGAEQTMEQGNKLFSLTPESEAAGKVITGSAQKKINEGKQEISRYEELARWLKVGGIVLIIV